MSFLLEYSFNRSNGEFCDASVFNLHLAAEPKRWRSLDWACPGLHPGVCPVCFIL